MHETPSTQQAFTHPACISLDDACLSPLSMAITAERFPLAAGGSAPVMLMSSAATFFRHNSQSNEDSSAPQAFCSRAIDLQNTPCRCPPL